VRCFAIELIQYSIYDSIHVCLLKEEEDWKYETEGEPTGGQQKRLYDWLRAMRRRLSEFCLGNR
jgi:hypothetical protein